MKLYHNPACGKSRIAIKHLQSKYGDLQVVNYLANWLDADEIMALIERSDSPAADFVRWDDARMLGIKMEDKSDARKIAELIAKQPKILQRPLVDDGEKVVICRSDEVLSTF